MKKLRKEREKCHTKVTILKSLTMLAISILAAIFAQYDA